MKDKHRCVWVSEDPLYIAYHDEEWGVPLFDDQKLFEFLILEGMQAGLSWITILKKRENFRGAFDNFDAEKMVRYQPRIINRLLNNPGIIRNRLKIDSAIINAQIYLEIKEQYPSFADYIWNFVDGKPLQNNWKDFTKVPATTAVSDRMAKELKKRGFKFVGSTICYAFMQAVGMVNDHSVDCFRHKEIAEKSTQPHKNA
jgi:DNA-3-methyladenine glycosylase I